MKTLSLKTISIIMWTWFMITSVFLTPLLSVLWILTVWWDKNRRILHQFSCFWGAQYIWTNPLWSLKVTGRKNFKNRGKYLVLSNHQSLVDIVVVYSTFRHFRWTSKESNFRLPFVGWVLRFNRSIRIYRKDKNAFEKFRVQAERELNSGNSIMVFPEGTRSVNGELGKFQEGAFRIALNAGADILPMVLDGTSRAIPKKGWSMTGKEKMRLKILKPIPYEEIKMLGPKELMIKVKALISKELEEMRKYNV